MSAMISNPSPIRQIIERRRNGDSTVDLSDSVFPLRQSQRDHQVLWAAFLDTARSYLPKEVRRYLTLGSFDLSKVPPRSLGEYSEFYLVEESIAPVRIMFTSSGGMAYFEVPSIGNRAGKYDWFWETASMFEDLADAFVAADNRFKERQAFRQEAGI